MKMPQEEIETAMFAPCGMNCVVCYKHCCHKKPCRGCLNSDSDKPKHCRTCKIKDCAKINGISYCYECDNYPCKQIKKLEKSYHTRYDASLIANSLFVREHGITKFMLQQKEKYTCAFCGGIISLHDAVCSECGRGSLGFMESRIELRNFTDHDMVLFKKWLYIPHVAQWYHHPLDWIEEVEKRNSDFNWLRHFIVESGSRPIGFCQYYEYVHSGETWHGDIEVNGTYSIDYMIGEAEYLRKGFGKAIIKELMQRIKSEDHAKRIIVQPEPENKASCNTLLACGFVFDTANEVYLYHL